VRTATSSNNLHPKISNPGGDKRIIILLGVQVLSHRLRSVRFCKGPVGSYGCQSVGVGSEQYPAGVEAVSQGFVHLNGLQGSVYRFRFRAIEENSEYWFHPRDI
jgi:hypothetical protein